MPDYSLVIPVYFNEGCLIPLMESLYSDVISKNPQLSCEIIFVDDGSGDRSLEELLVIREKYDQVKIVKLTRNFGQVNALIAGFTHAQGKCVIAMSADGQDPPAMINEMLAAHYQEDYEVVICTREGRDESYYRVATSHIFYLLIKKLVFPNMPESGFDFVLFGERALKTYLKNVDAVLQIAREDDLVISMTVYHQRLRKSITANNARAWAKWLAQRYKDVPNIVWSSAP